jgi:cytochrome P450
MYCRAVLTGRLVKTIERLHQEYGRIVRIAPDEVSVIDGDAWKAIYGTRPGHGQKPKDTRFYTDTIDNAASIIKSNDADHSRFRRLLSHAFSDHSLQGQEDMIRGYVDLLIRRLHENTGASGQAVDMVAWFNFTTFDIIGDMAFGEPFGCLQNSSYHYWVAFIFGNIKMGAYNNVLTRLPGARYLLPLVVPAKILSQKKAHEEMTKSKVQSRLQKTNDRPDFFSNILKHSGTEKGFSDSELATNASTLIIAGSETTATFLSGAVFHLLRNPDVLSKLQAEVRAVFTSDSEITLATTSKLVYMPAVINETFRMYPPVPVGLPRIVDAQGDMISGHWIPGGVSCQTYYCL